MVAVQYRWIRCDAMRDYLVLLLMYCMECSSHYLINTRGQRPLIYFSIHSTPIACAIPCGVYKIDRQSRAIRETESQPFFKSELPFAFYRRGVLVLCLGSGGY